MPIVPKRRSPSSVPARSTRASSLSIEALANRLAALEAKSQAAPGSQVIPPFSLLTPSAQSGQALNIVVQGGGSPAPPPTGSFADPSLTYITVVDESGNLPNARRLVAGTNITIVDGGAGTTLTINALAAGMFFTVVNTSTTPYSVASTDVFIGGSAGAGADQVINLPAATGTGRVLIIKKMDANAHNIVITRAGADLIDGATTATITVQYDTVRLVDDASGVWSTW